MFTDDFTDSPFFGDRVKLESPQQEVYRLIKNLMGLQEVVDFVKRSEANYSISISGQKVSQQHYLKPFDRVEFLRPVKLTPKEWRRKRARENISC